MGFFDETPQPGSQPTSQTAGPGSFFSNSPGATAQGLATSPPHEAIPSNPIDFGLGWLGNLWEGAQNIVGGITGILKAGAHDVVTAVKEPFGGDEGYQLAAIGRALPSAVKADYATRYGGLSNILRGLYENPLAYIGDVFMFAGGIGAVAKVGRAGMFSKLPALMPESMAQRVLGVTPEQVATMTGAARYKPFTQVTATEVALNPIPGGGIVNVPLRQNPMSRLVQKGLLGVASLGPDDAGKILSRLEGQPAAQQNVSLLRLNAAIDIARANNIRILRPGKVGPLHFKLYVSRALATQKANFAESSRLRKAEYEEQLHSVLRDPDVLESLKAQGLDPESSEARAAIVEQADAIAGGHATPVDLSINDAIPFPHDLPVVAGRGDLPPAQAVVNAQGGSEASVLLHRAAEESVGGGAVASMGRYSAPELGLGPESRLKHPSIVIQAPVQDFARVTTDIADRLQAEILGTLDTLGDVDTPFVEFTTALRMPDGSVAHVSMATSEMVRAQVAATDIVAKTTDLLRAKYDLVRELRLADPESPEALALAARIADLDNNVWAGMRLAESMFEGTRRSFHASDVHPYDPVLRMIDWARPENYLNSTKEWLENSGGTFGGHMARQYQRQRALLFMGLEGKVMRDVRPILEAGQDTDDVWDDLVRYFNSIGVPDSKVEEILGQFPWRADAELGALRLARNFRYHLWEEMVSHGDRGFETGWEAFDWRAMHNERVIGNLPTPLYMSERPVRTTSSYIMRGGSGGTPKSMRVSVPSTARTSRALLFETMNYDKDVVRAWSRAADEAAKHQNSIDLLDHLTKSFGRWVSREEAAQWPNADLGEGAEVLLPIQAIRTQLGLRGQIDRDVILGIAAGEDPVTAIRNAWEMLNQRAMTEGTNALNSRVIAMPRSVWDAFRAQTEWTLGGGAILRGYSSTMQLWKKMVLSLTPRWLFNNFGGNNIFTLLDDPGSVRYSLNQLERNSRNMMGSLFGERMIQEVEQGFFRSVGAGIPLPGESFAPGLERLGAPGKFLNRRLTRLSGKMYHWNTVQEQAYRRGIFLSKLSQQTMPTFVRGFHESDTLLRKVFATGFDEADFSAAAKAVDRVLGNYERFSPIEQQLIRRFFVPFYPFYRHAVKTLVKMPFDHPLKSRFLQQIQAIDEQMNEDMPGYLEDAVKVADFGPEDIFLRLRSLNPLAFAQDNIPIFSALNPIAKNFVEWGTGISTFTGQAFPTPEDVFDVQGVNWRIKRDGSGNPIGVERIEGPAGPGIVDLLASNVPLLPILHPSFEIYEKALWSQVAAYAGVSLLETDPTRAMIFEMQNEIDARRQMARRALAENT